MRILVIGTGYVGLVTGTCMAEMGHHVTCLDIDEQKIEKLRQGIIPIYEPGLEEMIKRNVKAERLEFTTEYENSVSSSLFCFIAVGTPAGEDGSADLTHVMTVAKSLAKHMDDYKIIVTKSTVPVGSAKLVRNVIASTLEELGVEVEFDVVSNPEFLKEGSAIVDFMRPDRIILGVDNVRVQALMKELYAPFTHSHDRILVMDVVSAELSKYAANAMLATRISFMNEMAELCERVGADVNQVRRGIGSDKRIGYQFLYPGPGFGGSCLPKDIRALQNQAKKYACPLHVLTAVEDVNDKQKTKMAHKVEEYFAGYDGVEGKTFAILGLSFKPDTDDIRESPALVLVRMLAEKGAKLHLFDPAAMENAKKELKGIPALHWCSDIYSACDEADALVLMTEWKEFRMLNFEEVGRRMKKRTIFDARNQYSYTTMRQHRFDYICLGVKPSYACDVERVKIFDETPAVS